MMVSNDLQPVPLPSTENFTGLVNRPSQESTNADQSQMWMNFSGSKQANHNIVKI